MRIGKEGRNFLIFVMILMWATLYAAKAPMESISRYNVILVHGAGDSLGGMDCFQYDYDEPYLYKDSITGLPQKIGGIGDHSSATGMIKLMAPWLRDTIFEDPSVVYLQRPFTNPAGSPVENAKEIGNPTWDGGQNGCSVRRSLIEEAQEFRAKGRASLASKRQDPYQYRTLPSRNIIIAHSMGGLATREYIQGGDMWTR